MRKLQRQTCSLFTRMPKMETRKTGAADKGGARYLVSDARKVALSEQSTNTSSKRTAASVVSGTTAMTSQRSQKQKVSIAIQNELTWPQGADTPVPVKTNSQTTQTYSDEKSAKNTEMQPLLLLHQEVTEVQILQYPLPVKAVRGTLNPHRPLHLLKITANQKSTAPLHDQVAMYSRYGVLDLEGGGDSDAE